MSNNIDDNDLLNKSDEDLKNETLKILEEDVFEEAEKISKTKVKNSSNDGYKDSSGYHNYSYKTREDTSKYNNYRSYSEEDELVTDIKNKRGINVIFIFVLAVFILFILIISVGFNFVRDDYYDYSYEEVYDVEYDSDYDGYLDYEEREIYEADKTSDYKKLINVSEFFNDKEYKRLFFKIENRNNYIIDNATLNIAFYDNENNLMFVEKTYIDNLPINKEILVSQHYEKEYDHMEATVTVDLGYGTPREKDADIIVVSSNVKKGEFENTVNYTIKNNSTLPARGDVYMIFYDANGEIITIKEDYFIEIKSGEELDGEYIFYYDEVKDLNSIEIDVSNFVQDVY